MPSKEIDQYLSVLPDWQLQALTEIRNALHRLVPGLEEGVSYGMPAFKLGGKPFVYFAAFKQHCSFFPGNSATIEALKTDLGGYKISKGTIQFTQENPLRVEVLEKLLAHRKKQ